MKRTIKAVKKASMKTGNSSKVAGKVLVRREGALSDVRKSVKESVSRSIKENAAVWSKLSKY